MKKYLINESQYKLLIQKKKDNKTISRFYEDINKIKKTLKSQILIEESVKDKVILYKKRGLLTKGVINMLNEENFFDDNSIVL